MEELLRLDKPLFRKYALKDAIITEQILRVFREKFIKLYKVDVLREKTLPSVVSACYRIGLKKSIPPPDPKIRDMGLLCAWGGRSELYYRGFIEGNIYELDFVSIYSFCAIQIGEFPRPQDWFKLKDIQDISYQNVEDGFVKVRFKFPKNTRITGLPAFNNNNLLFQRDGVSYCTISELRAVREYLNPKVELIEGYAYRRGVGDGSLPKFLKSIYDKKQEAEEKNQPIERQVYKSLQTNLIGKFGQKRICTNLNDFLSICEEQNIPPEYGMTFQDIEDELYNNKEPRYGACFYIEWNSLILGRARSLMLHQLLFYEYWLSLVGGKILSITTDSIILHSPKKIPFEKPNIFTIRNKATKYYGIRNRVYALEDEGGFVKVAGHGIWAGKEEAGKIIKEAVLSKKRTITYKTKIPIKIRSALRKHKKFGSWEESEFKFNATWDCKRVLLPNGETRPLKNITEHDRLRKQVWEKKAKLGLCNREKATKESLNNINYRTNIW
jgi:hypothetical protein